MRKGLKGANRLTADLDNRLQNYYGIAIRSHIGDKPGMITAITAIYCHHGNDHSYCPPSESSWCQYNRGDPSYAPKKIQPEVLDLMEPVFERLSDEDLLERLQRGDAQNSNDALHSLIWRRCPKGVFASLEIIRFSTSLAVIQRNVGSIGLATVLQSLGILDTAISERFLERYYVTYNNTIIVIGCTSSNRAIIANPLNHPLLLSMLDCRVSISNWQKITHNGNTLDGPTN